VGPTISLDIGEQNENLSPLTGYMPDSPMVQPSICHYTDCQLRRGIVAEVDSFTVTVELDGVTKNR
jgi:hypothetical protein